MVLSGFSDLSDSTSHLASRDTADGGWIQMLFAVTEVMYRNELWATV